MPNRIIREGHLDSERVDRLSDQAEVFYSRLRLIVDDYGRFEYKPAAILSRTFPLRAGRYTIEQFESWIAECTRGPNPLVIVYRVGNKQYLQVQNFNQRIRKVKKTGQLVPSKFPAPPDSSCSGVDREAPSLAREAREVAARATTTTTTTSPPSHEKILSGENNASEATESAADVAGLIRQTCLELLPSHPKMSPLNYAETAIQREIFDKGLDPVKFCESLRQSHARHCGQWRIELARDPKAFIPLFHVYVRDGYYIHQAIAESRSPPRKGDNLREELRRLEEAEAG